MHYLHVCMYISCTAIDFKVSVHPDWFRSNALSIFWTALTINTSMYMDRYWRQHQALTWLTKKLHERSLQIKRKPCTLMYLENISLSNQFPLYHSETHWCGNTFQKGRKVLALKSPPNWPTIMTWNFPEIENHLLKEVAGFRLMHLKL